MARDVPWLVSETFAQGWGLGQEHSSSLHQASTFFIHSADGPTLFFDPAAISAGLAQGVDVPSAVRSACRYIQAGIRTAPRLGRGNGPLDHFHSIQTLPFSP